MLRPRRARAPAGPPTPRLVSRRSKAPYALTQPDRTPRGPLREQTGGPAAAVGMIGPLVLRADGSDRLDQWRLARQLRLAEAWRAAGGAATLVTHRPSARVQAAAAALEIEVHTLTTTPGTAADGYESKSVAEGVGAVALCSDGPHLGSAWRAAAAGCPSVVFAPQPSVALPNAAMVVCAGFGQRWAGVRGRAPHARLLLGPAFAVLPRGLARSTQRLGARHEATSHAAVFAGPDWPEGAATAVCRALSEAGWTASRFGVGPTQGLIHPPSAGRGTSPGGPPWATAPDRQTVGG